MGKRRKTGNQNKSISFFDHKKHLMETYFKILISFFFHISDTCLAQFIRADTECLPPSPISSAPLTANPQETIRFVTLLLACEGRTRKQRSSSSRKRSRERMLQSVPRQRVAADSLPWGHDGVRKQKTRFDPHATCASSSCRSLSPRGQHGVQLRESDAQVSNRESSQ